MRQSAPSWTRGGFVPSPCCCVSPDPMTRKSRLPDPHLGPRVHPSLTPFILAEAWGFADLTSSRGGTEMDEDPGVCRPTWADSPHQAPLGRGWPGLASSLGLPRAPSSAVSQAAGRFSLVPAPGSAQMPADSPSVRLIKRCPWTHNTRREADPLARSCTG